MTIADTTAQKVIVSSLLGMYPNLDIVGEEDESVDVDMDAKQVLNDELFLMDNPRLAFHLPRELAEDDDLEEPPEELDMSEVVVFVDPLDGTREFVEGRLDNVQCLIGLVYRGVPLMGVLGLPFPSNIDNSIEAVFGLVGRGSGKCIKDLNGDITSCPLPELKRFKDGNDIYLSTGDSTSSFMCAAIKTAEQVFEFRELKRQIVGATGNKLLRVACGESTLTVQHDKTSLWDTAAPTAVLVSLGGHITDIFGDPLIYEKKELGNKLGVVASAPGAKKEHLGLVNAMRSEKNILSILNRFGFKCDDGSSQCVDIVRDLDGYPLSASYFAEKMKIDNIESYSCPEEEAVRGLMSNACRVNFLPSGDTAFYKRIVFAHLDHARNKMRTAPHKLIRDVKSYQVETSFLSSTACKEVIEKAGLKIPTCFDAKLMPDDQNPIASKFSVLLEDFSPSNGWSQKWLLRSDAECKTTLTALAKMHAFFWSGSSFWNDDEAAKELENGVWESASYVQPKLQTLNQCKDVAKGWNSSRIKCKNELDAFDFWDNLGERLETVAEECGRLAHPFALDALSDPYKKYRTFTHGDPKQANIFFRENGSVLEVGLIDFQWSGFGLAAT